MYSRQLIASIAGVAMTLVAAGHAQEPDPVVRGKKLSEWTQILRTDPELRKRQAALLVLEVSVGKSKTVVPLLLQEARHNAEPLIRSRCLEILPKFKDQSDRVVDTMIAAVQEDKSEKVRAAAARSAAKLDRTGFGMVSALTDALKDPDPATRLHAAESIGHFSRIDSEIAKEAIPNLITCLEDKDATVRREAAFVLGRIGTSALPALNALATRVANDPVIAVRREAAKTLGVFGAKAAAALPALVAALADRDAEMRQQAAVTLGQMGPSVSAALPELLKATRDKDKSVRSDAIHALGKMGKAAVPVIPDLIRILKDEEVPEVKLAAIQELGEFGPDAKLALEALTIASRDGRPSIREAAAEALKKIQKPTP